MFIHRYCGAPSIWHSRVSTYDSCVVATSPSTSNAVSVDCRICHMRLARALFFLHLSCVCDVSRPVPSIRSPFFRPPGEDLRPLTTRGSVTRYPSKVYYMLLTMHVALPFPRRPHEQTFVGVTVFAIGEVGGRVGEAVTVGMWTVTQGGRRGRETIAKADTWRIFLFHVVRSATLFHHPHIPSASSRNCALMWT